MSQSSPRGVSQDSPDEIRKRVSKACDRCRLKKSKCDGAHPCYRCKIDNAICVFGERKKSSDKVYPKGYVEMLEQQQSQLVSGLQEMYKRLSIANAWGTETLSETNGHPLTHDILAALDLLECKPDGSGDLEPFEEDCKRLQGRLLAEGAKYVHRRASFSSDSDHSQQQPHHSRNVSHSTPSLIHTPPFPEHFSFGSSASSPTLQSPTEIKPTLRGSVAYTQPPSAMPLQNDHHFVNQSYHPHSPLLYDPHLFQTNWTMPDMNPYERKVQPRWALQTDRELQQLQHQPRSLQPDPRLQPQHTHNVHRPSLTHLNQLHAASVPCTASGMICDVSLQQQQLLLIQQQQQQQHQQEQQLLFDSTNFDANMPTELGNTFVDDMQMDGYRSGLFPNGTIDGSFDPMAMDGDFSKVISVTT